MKYLISLILIIFISACNHTENLDKYISELPDSEQINDIIACVLKIDTLNTGYKVKESIRVPIVYKTPIWENDSVPLPPPPVESISYDDLFSFFHDDSINQKHYDDSVFISLQVDTLRKFKVDKYLMGKFDNNSSRYYSFNTPIFSFDKKKVVIRYWRICGGLCGNCNLVLLKKENNEWVKIESWNCGEM
jgi:hypothetical protein